MDIHNGKIDISVYHSYIFRLALDIGNECHTASEFAQEFTLCYDVHQ